MTELFHPHVTNALGIIALAIWLHLFFGRGWFWRVRKADADRGASETLGEWPSVIAVVPARNEAETIERVVTGLVQQDYPGAFSAVVVDDHSEDGTASIAQRVAAENGARVRVRVLNASQLPEGWTGKLWALNEGMLRGGVTQPGVSNGGGLSAAPEVPEFYWFTDADVSHAPNTLRRLVGRAERERLDLA